MKLFSSPIKKGRFGIHTNFNELYNLNNSCLENLNQFAN